MRGVSAILVLLLPMAVGGCVSTAVGVVKAPFQVVGKAVDWTTTSQEEADRNYGRKMRKQEAKEGKARREFAERCRKHLEGEDCRTYQGYRAGN